MPKPGKKVQMAVEPEEAEAPGGDQSTFENKGKLRRMDTPAAGVLMYARSQMRSLLSRECRLSLSLRAWVDTRLSSAQVCTCRR